MQAANFAAKKSGLIASARWKLAAASVNRLRPRNATPRL